MKTSWISTGTGFLTGILNGLFGAGGGMVAVPGLRKAGLEGKEAHASSLALILPLSAVSAFLYLQAGQVLFRDAFPYLPGAVAGACAGAWLMPKIPTNILRKLFGVFILYAAFRLLTA